MIKILIMALIIGLFFVQKVGTHGILLKSPYDQIFKTFKTIFDIVQKPLSKIIKPINIGNGLNLDIIPFIILIILLIISK